jgi:hypothetical protein
MFTKHIPAALLGAATAFGLTFGTAFAATNAPANTTGYVYPDFWAAKAGQQQATTSAAVQRSNDGSVGIYVTKDQNTGTWLFPPHPWQ